LVSALSGPRWLGRVCDGSGFSALYSNWFPFCEAINGPDSKLACDARPPFSIRLRNAIARVIAACQCSYGTAFGPIRREVVDRGEPSVGMHCGFSGSNRLLG